MQIANITDALTPFQVISLIATKISTQKHSSSSDRSVLRVIQYNYQSQLKANIVASGLAWAESKIKL